MGKVKKIGGELFSDGGFDLKVQVDPNNSLASGTLSGSLIISCQEQDVVKGVSLLFSKESNIQSSAQVSQVEKKQIAVYRHDQPFQVTPQRSASVAFVFEFKDWLGMSEAKMGINEKVEHDGGALAAANKFLNVATGTGESHRYIVEATIDTEGRSLSVSKEIEVPVNP